eukprot:70316_1
MSVGSVQILRLFVVFYITFALLPLCSYWIYQLYGHKNELFVQKRNLKMTLALNFSLLLFSIMSCVFAMGTFLYSLICKSWIIYYDYQYIMMRLSLQWTSIINATSHSTNWFLRNRTTFGNLNWIGLRLAVLFIVLSALAFFSIFMMFSAVHLFALIGLLLFIASTVLPFTAYIVILCKTPSSQKYSDSFFIHWESKLIAKFLAILILLFSIGFGIAILVFMFVADLLPYYTAVWGALIPSYIAVMIYASTKLIINKNDSSLDKHHRLERLDSLSNQDHALDRIPAAQRLYAILADTDALNLFMLHLTKEYSMEILLSFIEFCQYLDYLESFQSDTQRNAAMLNFNLTKTLPVSSIVLNEDDDFKRKGYALYCKYISSSSEYEINIRSKLRTDLSNVMNRYEVCGELNITATEMHELFRECQSEMFMLLCYAHSRFTTSDEYPKVMQIISDSKIASISD